MGIKCLNKFLINKFSKQNKELYKIFPVSLIKGVRLAVDTDLFLHMEWSNALSDAANGSDLLEVMDVDMDRVYKMFIKNVLTKIRYYCNNELTLLFVFDGKNKHELKKGTQQKRKDSTKRGRETYEEHRKQLIDNPLNVNKESLQILRSKYRQGMSMPQEHRLNASEIIKKLGFPYAVAKGDGEQLACALCIENYVNAVLSVDTDCLAFGSPIIVNSIFKNKVKAVYLEDVLTVLGLKQDEFIDLCIMSGNDYNDNIPNLAISKSYDALKLCKSINNLSQSKQFKNKDISLYNHTEVRKIFTLESTDNYTEYIDIDGTGEISKDVLDICLDFDILDIIPGIKKYLERRTICNKTKENMMFRLRNMEPEKIEPPSMPSENMETVADKVEKLPLNNETENDSNEKDSDLKNINIVSTNYRLKRMNFKIPK